MRSLSSAACFGILAAIASAQSDNATLVTDYSVYSQYWGELAPYRDNADQFFGVENVGLPDGCQIEQVHTLQRHAQRFPTGYIDDGGVDKLFAAKLKNFTSSNSNAQFTGPLAFLNSWHYIMGSSYLTGVGASTEVAAGVQFWNNYGRTLYNASIAQLAYNGTAYNGTNFTKPVLRTTSESRIENSQINWALGFFGPSFMATPDPGLDGWNSEFDVVIIPEGGTENNTLAATDSCFNDDTDVIGSIGDNDLFQYLPIYLEAATQRLQQYAPSGFTFDTNDTYAFQSLCAYETSYIGQSSFCNFFTLEEWQGFEHSLNLEYYYDFSFGNPTGRGQGVGYVQEILARLQNEYIPVSNTSINSSYDNNPTDFPLGRPFYADFSHDDIIVSVLTAMSMDYFRVPPNLTEYPPNQNTSFRVTTMVPFGARLVTEVIGCGCSDPDTVQDARVQYFPTQYGYDAANATNKFVRQRLNHGILPLESIRGGYCEGRSDGLCSMDSFIAGLNEAVPLANYQYACFANYTINDPLSGKDYDGTIFANGTSP